MKFASRPGERAGEDAATRPPGSVQARQSNDRRANVRSHSAVVVVPRLPVCRLSFCECGWRSLTASLRFLCLRDKVDLSPTCSLSPLLFFPNFRMRFRSARRNVGIGFGIIGRGKCVALPKSTRKTIIVYDMEADSRRRRAVHHLTEPSQIRSPPPSP